METKNNSDNNVKKEFISEAERQHIFQEIKFEIKQEINPRIQKDIKNDLRIWCIKCGSWILFIVSVVGFIGYNISIRNIYNKLSVFVTDSISDKFAEPYIQETLTKVAQDEAKKIIERKLNPAIDEAKFSIIEKMNTFDKVLKEFKTNYDDQLAKLSKEVEFLKNRNEILRLGDKATSTGNASSFDKLFDIFEIHKNDDIGTAALSEIFRTKTFLRIMSRDTANDLKYTDPGTGIEFENKEIPTEALISSIRDKNWKFRNRAVKFLASKKEKGVPDTLLDVLRSDDNLEVRLNAMRSFKEVTGFVNTDDLENKQVSVWWDKNKERVEKDLNELMLLKNALEARIQGKLK